MAKKERKSRKKLSKKTDMTKPILPMDILKFGTDEDPCFGKLHDLTEDACKRCGDSSLCSIVLNQDTKKLRAKEEKDGRFKDIELSAPAPTEKDIKKFIKAKLEKGTITVLIKKQVIKKFGISKEEASKLIKKCKD